MLTALHVAAADHAVGVLALGGFFIGLPFGWIVYRSNFCVMGSLSDIYNLDDWRRFRAWVLAAAVALVLAQTFASLGIVALERSMYLSTNLNWLGHALGGFVFGFGMVLAGGCPTRNLVRFGNGDLRALVVLVVIAVAGFATIGGIIAPVRNFLEQATAIDLKRFGIASQSLGEMLGRGSASRVNLALAAVLGAAGLVYALGNREFRSSRLHVGSGLAVGGLVAAGWAVTGLTFDDLAAPTAPVSLTFIRPLGDTLDWLQRFTAIPWPGFGIATVFGTWLGAFLAARRAGRFRVLGFANLGDMKANLTGACLMGVGGALALGCTIGQGITGLSTLAIGSIITTAALVYGGWQGLRYLERSMEA